MSRRGDYPVAERYDERESEFYRRPRRERNYDDLEVDITNRSRVAESRRGETVFKERDTYLDEHRGPRRPDFLREDYGKSSNAGQLVVREDRREEDVYSRRPSRKSNVEKDEIVIREKGRGLPYPRSQHSEIDFREDEEVVFKERTRSRPPPREERSEEEIVIRERTRSRPPPREERSEEEVIIRERTRSRPPPREERSEEKIDISIRRDESRPPPPRERDIEEITFRRGGGELPTRSRSVVEREEIDIRESRSPARPRREVEKEEIDIDIRERRRGREEVKREIDIREERSVPPPQRSVSRGALVARKEEEWIVRRERDFTPPPRDYEKEEIIIRRKERTPSPEPVREPTPEPPPPPPLEPIYRPPIIQEYITHHRHIDHGVERARSPTPEPPPTPPSPPREDNFEVEIRRSGLRNGKPYSEEVIFDREEIERKDRDVSRRRDISISSRRRGFEEEIVETRSRAPSTAPAREIKEEIKITDSRTTGERSRRRDKMWTEVTKDLVIREAIDECGYDCDETDEFFYVMEYLKYEDVLRLVEVTEDIRRERRERIREIQWQREESERAPKMLPPAPPPPRSRYDERIYEREYIVDRDGRRWRRG